MGWERSFNASDMVDSGVILSAPLNSFSSVTGFRVAKVEGLLLSSSSSLLLSNCILLRAETLIDVVQNNLLTNTFTKLLK